jgi:outer membrane protein OmpA-like peptidoglycan-associated protein
MKQFKIAIIAFFSLLMVGNVNAQDENNPWVVGFGANVVDFYNTSSNFGNQVDDLFGNSDWNIIPSITRITVDKYLEKGFSLQLAGSLNKIETVVEKNDSDFMYYSFDAVVKYDINNLLGETAWFDPFVYLGGSYVSADSVGEGMLNSGIGFNTWFNDNIGLNFQTGTKIGFADNIKTHYQSSLGVVFKFGGKDTDGDGVYDKNDACIDVPGLEEFNGCPDADGDGIKDSDDACPNVAGLASLNGCPDADADGIADKDDMCPDAKGTKANKGCPDTDGDGVVDKDDTCVSVAGPAANAGCPWPDTDGDSVLDKDDECVDVAGVASNNGCPEPIISAEAKKFLEDFRKIILFNTGKTVFKSGVSVHLDDVVEVMSKFSDAIFEIQGHTDSQGSAAFNLKLSDKRANVVKDYFVKKGIEATRMVAVGYGEEQPVKTNMNKEGRAANRSVAIKVTNE